MSKFANDKPFSIHIQGENSGRTWIGEFRAKIRLSHRDYAEIDRERRRRLGGEEGQPSERVALTAHILSQLYGRLTEAPEWWRESDGGWLLEDDNLITECFNRAKDIETKAVEEKQKQAKEIQEKARAEKAKEEAEADEQDVLSGDKP